MYKHLINYFIDNEYDNPINDPDNMLISVIKDERNDELLQMIVDHTHDTELLLDMSSEILKDMIVYYSKHSKDFKPVEFDYYK